MDSTFWLKVHGGTTHFPIALLIASALFDLVGYVLNREPHSRDLHAASFYALLLGAVASLAAVVSGLVIAHWETFGTGLLGKHHIFLWPAFALLIGLAVWRIVVRSKASRRAFAAYLIVLTVTALLMTAAGYWGGQMVLGGSN